MSFESIRLLNSASCCGKCFFSFAYFFISTVGLRYFDSKLHTSRVVKIGKQFLKSHFKHFRNRISEFTKIAGTVSWYSKCSNLDRNMCLPTHLMIYDMLIEVCSSVSSASLTFSSSIKLSVERSSSETLQIKFREAIFHE